jgi:hypothetical protein
MQQSPSVRWIVGFALLLAAPLSAERIWLVRDGVPVADIHAVASAWPQAEWLVRRVEQWTGAKLMVLDAAGPPNKSRTLTRLYIGPPEACPDMRKSLPTGTQRAALGDEGYALIARDGPAVILAAGHTPASLHYALGELVNYRLEVTARDISCEPFEVLERPVLPYRWFWLSTSYAHWDAQYGSPHLTDETMRTFGPHPDGSDLCPSAYPGQSLGRDAYFNTYKAMVDWMSEHKLNGAMLFGYLNSGIDVAREVARYGSERGVSIITGVGSMGYWGVYYGGYNEYHLDTLMKIHPEWTHKNERGAVMVCPSVPEMQAYWRQAGRWLATAMPELDGLYLENGDFMFCPCEQCAAQRKKEENDSAFFWDMMASEVPIIEGAAESKPKWKYVYATYTGFHADGLKHGTNRNPPRFPEQFPPYAICQWTVTGLNESNWPADLKAPAPHSVGLFHSPSVWGAPDGKDRWWAGPGSSHDDASRMVQFYCQRMAATGFEGLIVKGMKNHHSPGPLLSYLALSEFSWHPERTREEWERGRLGRLFGGPDRAAQYLRIVRDSSRDLAVRRELIAEALGVANDQQLSPRARPYWQDLARELEYRVRLLETLKANKEQKEAS